MGAKTIAGLYQNHTVLFLTSKVALKSEKRVHQLRKSLRYTNLIEPLNMEHARNLSQLKNTNALYIQYKLIGQRLKLVFLLGRFEIDNGLRENCQSQV